MAEDLVKRLREAHTNSTQRILGSNIFETAADLIDQQAASLAAKDKEIERLHSKCDTLEKATAHEWFCNQLGEIGFIGIRGYAAMQARAEQAERVFTDLCEELGCKSDNEAALEAVAALKRALAKAVEVMRPLVDASEADYVGDVCTDEDPDESVALGEDGPSAVKFGMIYAARAFVAQHGSDSTEGK